MFVHITKATHVSDWKLWLEFNDGTRGEVDLRDELEGEIFEPLRDLEFFESFVLDPELDTVVWSNGADFAPEYLRDLVQREREVA